MLVVMLCHTSPGILTVLRVLCSLNLLFTFWIQISGQVFQDTHGKTRRNHLTSLNVDFRIHEAMQIESFGQLYEMEEPQILDNCQLR